MPVLKVITGARDNTDPVGARPEALPLSSGSVHVAGNNGSAGEHGQAKSLSDSAPRNLLSNADYVDVQAAEVGDVERSAAASMLREALDGLSSGDVGAAINAAAQHVRQMLNGDRPWKAEHFVRLALSYPAHAEAVIRVYSRLLPLESVRRLAAWFVERVRELEFAAAKRQEATSC